MLQVESLAAGYGAAPALTDIALTVADAELVCVVGPNGAGKSTLINTVGGLHRASAGRIVFDGADLTRAAAHTFCDHGIAIVPEGRRLFTALSVRENLELGAYRRAVRAVRARNLDKMLELFPALKVKLSAPAGSLSGGQQQMVAISRALMCEPRLLLLDEPSLGLAPAIVDDMFDAIARINAERVAVLLVEQNVSMALSIARRAYVLEEGRVVDQDEASAMLAKPSIRRAYLGL